MCLLIYSAMLKTHERVKSNCRRTAVLDEKLCRNAEILPLNKCTRRRANSAPSFFLFTQRGNANSIGENGSKITQANFCCKFGDRGSFGSRVHKSCSGQPRSPVFPSLALQAALPVSPRPPRLALYLRPHARPRLAVGLLLFPARSGPLSRSPPVLPPGLGRKQKPFCWST